MAFPLEGIPWNARGRIGQENLRRPDCCRGSRAWAAWCSSRFFFPGSLSQGGAEPLVDWPSNLEIKSCGCDSFEAWKRFAVFPAIGNELMTAI